MFIDGQKLPEDTIVEHDICIVGAGAAGITIARELIGQPYQVCLLEAGKLDFDAVAQSLYEGENIGLPYFPLAESRVRYFGGSTNLWGGTARPLDEIDFADRPWMPYSGWPFAKAELVPYYERAQTVCGLGAYKYNFTDWEADLNRLQRRNLPLNQDEIVTYIFQVMPQKNLRFGEVYRAELEQAPNIKTYYNANVIDIETNDATQAVTRLRVSSLEGNKFWVAAKTFILACGGIENPRLLLVSNRAQTAGLGNQHDLVGRFFMEHPYLRSGKVILTKPNALYPSNPRQKLRVNQIRLLPALALAESVQAREQVLNFATRLVPIYPEWLNSWQRLRSGKRQEHEIDDASSSSWLQDFSQVITNLDQVVARAWAKSKLKQPPFPERIFETHLIGEQAPNPDSRVLLSSEKDQLGLNRVKLDWRLSPIDKYTIQRSQQLIGEELARTQSGHLQIEMNYDDESWRSLMQRSQQVLDQKFAANTSKLEIRLHEDSYWQTLRGSYHHIGTTRMSSNPKEGVVNADCQVHGISNLYITGSSVFPTSGLSNPTLTIVALALRLADRLKADMRHSQGVTKALEAVST